MPSGKGDDGSGFCWAIVPAPKVALVGVVASSMAVCFGGGRYCGAVLGRGVVGDVTLDSTSAVSGGGGCDELTERKVAAIFVVVGGGVWRRSGAAEGSQRESRRIPREGDAALKKPVAYGEAELERRQQSVRAGSSREGGDRGDAGPCGGMMFETDC